MKRAYNRIKQSAYDNPGLTFVVIVIAMIALSFVFVRAVQEANQRETQATFLELGIQPPPFIPSYSRVLPFRYYDEEAGVYCWVAMSGIDCLPEYATQLLPHDGE